MRLAIFLCALVAASPIAFHLLVPLVQNIGIQFDITGSQQYLVLSAPLIALAIFPLIYGYMLDFKGVRYTLLFSLSLYIVGGVISLLAPDFYIFIFGRFLQSGGGAVGLTIARVVISRNYDGKTARIVMSIIAGSFALLPMFMPLLSIQLFKYYGIHIVLLVSIVFGVFLFLSSGVVPSKTNKQNIPSTFHEMIGISRDFLSLGYVTPVTNLAFSMTSYFIFIATAPNFYSDMFSANLNFYGYNFVIVSIAFFSGNLCVAALQNHLSDRHQIIFGSFFSMLCMLCMLLASFLQIISYVMIITLTGLMTFFQGISAPAANIRVATSVKKYQGIASAFAVFFQMLMSSLATYYFGGQAHINAVSFSGVLFVFCFLMFLSSCLLPKSAP